MASVEIRREPRYGSAADVAAYSSVSIKTIRRMIDAGKVRGLRLGRRVVVPFEDIDSHLLEAKRPRRPTTMPATPTLTTPEARPFVPPITPEELARRNAAAVALLDELEADVEGEQDQRETMAVLRQALGPGRVGSGRPALL